MNHVTNHSSDKKVLKRLFFTLAATMIVCTYHCGNSIAKESEERIKPHDAMIQVFPIAGVSEVLEAIPNSTKENILEQKTNNEKENKIYYIDDNGYESYLNDCYQDHLYKTCLKYGVKEYYTLFLAQMYHESMFQTDAISVTNDYGLMQINEFNHEWLRKKLCIDNFLDPYDNIEAGIYMMSHFLHKYNDVEKALVCYNEGEGTVINGTYSTNYSKEVIKDMDLLVELN